MNKVQMEKLAEKIAKAGESKTRKPKTIKAVASKPTAKPATTPKPKTVGNIIYYGMSTTTPINTFKDISTATPQNVGRRPNWTRFEQIGISVGQVMHYKRHPEITAIAGSLHSNELTVHIPEQDPVTTFGVVPAESMVREHLGEIKNSTLQGWDMWGFHIEQDGKTIWQPVYNLYAACFVK